MHDLTHANFNEISAAAADPSAKYRGSIFWALNGDLQPESMREQIRAFKKLGLGGFFLHARTGLSTPYLSEKWFECMRAAVDEAEKLAMQPWLYDEDRYPSGAAGGLVTHDPRYRAKGIFLQQLTASEAADALLPDNLLALFSGKVSGNCAEDIKKITPEKISSLNADETLLIFYTDTIRTSSWFNDFTYLDTLSKEAVQRFIAVTHEKYREELGELFQRIIPGFFTDEPRLGFVIDQPAWDTEHRLALPWTPGLLEEFAQRYNCDAVERLAEFFFQVKDCDSFTLRMNYMQTLEDFFLEAFVRPINEWCKKHDLILTGHPVAEDSLSYQTSCIGSAMQFNEYQEMPGMDLLTETHGAFQTAKQLSSVARQCGRNRRLAEIYGCTGWSFPLIGFKALAEWLYALGVNYRCEHLALYTVEGEAKRDYPGPIAIQTNDETAYRQMQDHLSRTSVWLSAGEEERNILLLLPLESSWGMIHTQFRKEESVLDFDCRFTAITTKLLENQLDFDYGEEAIISRKGKIKDKKFCIGAAAYSVVIVPDMKTMRRSTLVLLEEFMNQGGKVCSCGELPGYLDGIKCAYDFKFTTISNLSDLVTTLRVYSPLDLKADGNKAADALLSQVRRGSDWDLCYICNTGCTISNSALDGDKSVMPVVTERNIVYDSVSARFATRHNGALIEYDPQDNTYQTVDAEYCNGQWHWQCSFSRLQSRLFIALPAANPIAAPVKKPLSFNSAAVLNIPVEEFDWALSEKNAAVIDHFFTADAPDTPVYVLKLDDHFRTALDLPVRSGLMVQPWLRQYNEKQSAKYDFYAEFECRYLPEGEVELVIERPELYQIKLNGAELQLHDSGCWRNEAAWRKVQLPGKLLQLGSNRLDISTVIHEKHPGLEAMFLLGNFGVAVQDKGFVITRSTEKLPTGNWGENSLPFYPGKVILKKHIALPRAAAGKIRVNEFYGSPLAIRINGQAVAILLSSPGATEIMELPQEFDLEIVLSSSLRNCCGPFFSSSATVNWCGPDHFKSTISDHRHLLPLGIAGNIAITYQ